MQKVDNFCSFGLIKREKLMKNKISLGNNKGFKKVQYKGWSRVDGECEQFWNKVVEKCFFEKWIVKEIVI